MKQYTVETIKNKYDSGCYYAVWRPSGEVYTLREALAVCQEINLKLNVKGK